MLKAWQFMLLTRLLTALAAGVLCQLLWGFFWFGFWTAGVVLGLQFASMCLFYWIEDAVIWLRGRRHHV
jgi:hypothetical protein